MKANNLRHSVRREFSAGDAGHQGANAPGPPFGAAWLIALLATAPTALVAADDTAAGARPPSGATAESRTAWKYHQEIRLMPTDKSPWLDVLVTPPVFDGARADLADLRLDDAQGREIPYALRVRREEDTTQAVDAKEFNRSLNPDGTSQLSLDLGETKIEHNEVEVLTPGTNFRRHTLLEGSDDGNAWSKLAETNLLHFERAPEPFVVKTISYTPSRFRYLRITLRQDPLVDREPVDFGTVVVRRRVKVPGELHVRPVTFGERKPVRADGGPGSAWIIDLGGTGIPCDRIFVTVEDAEFARDYTVEAGGPPDSNERFEHVQSGVWRRRAGEPKEDMVAEFAEVQAARLRLVVTDYGNPSLRIATVKAAAPARVVIAARGDALADPLRLYFGHPKAEAPNYDFARNLPTQLEPAPVRFEAGGRQDNPVYQPEPPPLTERLPWLIYVLLGVAVAILAALIANLARSAIRLADLRQNPAA